MADINQNPQAQGNAASMPQPIAVPNAQNQTSPVTVNVNTGTSPASLPTPPGTPSGVSGVSNAGQVTNPSGGFVPPTTVSGQSPSGQVGNTNQGFVSPQPQAQPATQGGTQPNQNGLQGAPTIDHYDASGRPVDMSGNTIQQPQQHYDELGNPSATGTTTRPMPAAPAPQPAAADPAIAAQIASQNAAQVAASLASSINPFLNLDSQAIIRNGLTPPTSGIVTTGPMDQASATIGSAIDQNIKTPIDALVAQENAAMQQAISANQNHAAELLGYANAPGTDPQMRQLFAKEAELSTQMNTQIKNVQNQADADLIAREKSNKKLEGEARAATFASGLNGSLVGIGFINDQIHNNEDSLQSIKTAANQAIQSARDAFQSGDLQLAGEMVTLTETRKQQARDVMNQNADLAGKMVTIQQQNQQFSKSMQIQDMQIAQATQDNKNTVTQRRVDALSSSNADWAAVPEDLKQSITDFNGLTGQARQSWYETNRARVQAESAKSAIDIQKSQNDLSASLLNMGKYLPPGQTIEIPFNGKTLSVNTTQLQDTKQVMAQTPNGNFMVTYNNTGKEIGRTKISDNYVAPKFNPDTNTWSSYNPTTNQESVIQNNGQYGEGGSALRDAPQIVDQFRKRFGTPVQEPGGGFSHANLSAYDYKVPANTPLQSPVPNGIVINEGHYGGNLQQVSHTMNDFGNYVDIMNVDSGYVVRMAHFNQLNVNKGDHVTSDTMLGLSGNTGLSTAPHLHLEFRTSDDKAIRPNNFAIETGLPIKGGAGSVNAPTPTAIPDVSQFQADTGTTYNPQSKSSRKEFASWKAQQQRYAHEDAVAAAQASREENTIKNQQATQQRQDLSTIIRDPEYVKTVEGFDQRQTAASEFAKAYQVITKNPKSGVSARLLMANLERLTHPNPQTVIRPSEIASLENSQGLPDQFKSMITKLEKGQSLSTNQINDMKTFADNALSSERTNYDSQLTKAYQNAIIMGIDPRLIGKNVKEVRATGPDGKTYRYSSVSDPDLKKDIMNGFTLNVYSQ